MNAKPLLALALSLFSSALWAIGWKSGEWTFSLDGNINAYYTQMNCSGTLVSADNPIDQPQGIAALIGCDNSNHTQTASISNGFLPNALIFSVDNTRDKLLIGGVVGLYFSAGNSTSFQSGRSSFDSNKNLDIRQAYISFGSTDAGFFKLGRDYGLFGFNALLAGPNTVSVGAVSAYNQHRMTLGNVGAGTIYPGIVNSFTYTSPAINGFSAAVAISSPLAPLAEKGITYQKWPALTAQLNYQHQSWHLWGTIMHQRFASVSSKTSVFVYEVGADYGVGHGISLLLNYQGGAGLGLVELFDNLIDNHSTHTLDKARVSHILAGIAYRRGQMKVAYTIGRTAQHLGAHAADAGRLESNTNQTLGLYYSVTTNLTVSAEYDHFITHNFGTIADGRAQGISIGAALMF